LFLFPRGSKIDNLFENKRSFPLNILPDDAILHHFFLLESTVSETQVIPAMQDKINPTSFVKENFFSVVSGISLHCAVKEIVVSRKAGINRQVFMVS
jgi:hypothetical protein